MSGSGESFALPDDVRDQVIAAATSEVGEYITTEDIVRTLGAAMSLAITGRIKGSCESPAWDTLAGRGGSYGAAYDALCQLFAQHGVRVYYHGSTIFLTREHHLQSQQYSMQLR